ncbi:glycosyltransferase family 2 protein [Campylobacter lari]|uniref:glycosyltransferase family 2 protein n=1 Tax=Campylobacter lari TaxID=201 RepID=UPI003728276A
MSKISIILPTYNVEKYIARALDSCINQSFKDIEIIVVDDCGSDKSIDIAKEYASKDKRIKIIHNKENLKLLRARYEGIKVANSPFIMFLDPDDYLELNACEKCVEILDKNGDVDLICFNYYECEQTRKENIFFQKNILNKNEFIDFITKKLPYYNFGIWNKIYNKKIYLEIFNHINIDQIKITMAEDALIYTLYLNFIENNIATIDNCIYNYNMSNNDASTKTKDVKRILNYISDINDCIYHLEFFIKNKDQKYLFYVYSIIYYLKLIMLDYIYKYNSKGYFNRLLLRIKRKIVKIKKKYYIKKCKEFKEKKCFT